MKTFWTVLFYDAVENEFEREITVGLFSDEQKALAFAKTYADSIKFGDNENWTPMEYFEKKMYRHDSVESWDVSEYFAKGYGTTYRDRTKEVYVIKQDFASDEDI